MRQRDWLGFRAAGDMTGIGPPIPDRVPRPPIPCPAHSSFTIGRPARLRGSASALSIPPRSPGLTCPPSWYRLSQRGATVIDIKEKYVTDDQGNRVAVLLDVADYRRLLDALEELESIRAYDEAVAAREKPIPFDQAVKELKRDRG